LLLGAVVCFLLVPVVYWPGRRGKKSVFEAWGQPEWMGTFFLTVWVGTAVVMMMRTKARVYHADPKRTDPVVWY
jgi:hypothetical protein